MQCAENSKRKLVNLINPWYTVYQYRSLFWSISFVPPEENQGQSCFDRPAPFGPAFFLMTFFAVPYSVCTAAWNIKKSLIYDGVVIKCLNN